jgi:peptidoglycan/LPS O-acetylase OafA/YrhL
MASANDSRQLHLDGMRAVASVYVVLFHAVIGFPSGELTGAWRLLRRAAAFGHEAVAVFIVLSGYCLMLPVVRGGRDRLPRTFGSFIGRRALRILPPYYATLALSLLLLATVEILRRPGSGTIWDDSLPGFGVGPVVSHVLLVHNWVRAWAFQINGPLWSVATEWQIYFAFPLLIPVWRRFGLAGVVGLATVLGYLPLAFVPESAKAAIPWYLALFTLGMGAAAIVHSSRPFERRLRDGVGWGGLTVALWAIALIGGWFFGAVWFRAKPFTDFLLGLATSTFLVHAALGLERGKPGLLTRWLGSRQAVAVGHMSYSLYLTHLPILALCHFALVELALSPGLHALALIFAGTTCSLGLGWLFHLAIERPFIASPSPRPQPVPTAPLLATVDPREGGERAAAAHRGDL